MSFGGSPGDIITAGTLALRAYRACKAAAGEFAEVTREVSAVSILVQDLEDQAASPSFARNQQDCRKQAKLRSLIDGIIYALRELEELATKYSSLSTAKKNNWDRLRFATRSIDDIRARLILHTSAAQTILDGLTNRRVASIERKSDETNAALTRIEQVLADIVKDIKYGSRNPSVVSDERWNIWTELKRELRIEGYPVEVVQQHKDQIKQYLLDLLQDAGLQDEVLLDELDPSEINGSINEAQSSSSTQIQQPGPLQLNDANIVLSNLRTRSLALIFLLSITIAFVLHSIMPYRLSLAEESLARPSATPTSTREMEPISTREMEPIPARDANQVTLELKAGLFKNGLRVRFTGGNMVQAKELVDQLSPLVGNIIQAQERIDQLPPLFGNIIQAQEWIDQLSLVDESAIKVRPFLPSANEEASRALQANTATSPVQPMDASYCPRDPPRLDGYYWDIYSKEPPCGHQHE